MEAQRVILITGASSGIGLAIATKACREGHNVVLAARDSVRLGEIERILGHHRCVSVVCDVGDWEDQMKAVEAGVRRFGRIDAAVANAGIGAARGFLNDSPEQWRSMVLTNVYGTALTIRAVLPQLQATRGNLIIMGSEAGRTAFAGSLYSATKHAVGAMCSAVRQEVAGSGIRVTLVSPGLTATPFVGSRSAPMLRPDDIADAVMYVLSAPVSVNVDEIALRAL